MKSVNCLKRLILLTDVCFSVTFAGGDLLKLLRDDSKTLSVPEKIKMSEDAASGMAYLEGKSCIHR